MKNKNLGVRAGYSLQVLATPAVASIKVLIKTKRFIFRRGCGLSIAIPNAIKCASIILLFGIAACKEKPAVNMANVALETCHCFDKLSNNLSNDETTTFNRIINSNNAKILVQSDLINENPMLAKKISTIVNKLNAPENNIDNCIDTTIKRFYLNSQEDVELNVEKVKQIMMKEKNCVLGAAYLKLKN